MKKLKSIKSNKEGPLIAILGCVHGNETYSIRLFRYLKNSLKLEKGQVDCYLVNERAYERGVRFIESDLNRSFNLEKSTYESELSKKIKLELKKYDYIIDLHSTSSNTPPFLIFTKRELKEEGFPQIFGIKKLVLVPDAKYSLINQFNRAVSIEISSCKSTNHQTKNAKKYITNALARLNMIDKRIKKQNFHEWFIFVESTPKEERLKDFKLTKFNGEFYYPTLTGEIEYSNCFLLKKFY